MSKSPNEILLEKRSALVNGVPRGMQDGDLSGSPEPSESRAPLRRRPKKLVREASDYVPELIQAIQGAALGDYDSDALYTVKGKKVRIVSSGGAKVGSMYLVLVTDKTAKPIGVPFYAGDLARDPAGAWRAAVTMVEALALYGG